MGHSHCSSCRWKTMNKLSICFCNTKSCSHMRQAGFSVLSLSFNVTENSSTLIIFIIQWMKDKRQNKKIVLVYMVNYM